MLIDVDVDAVVAAKVEGLEKALTLTANSREWNRKRVVELEDELERLTGDRPSVRDSLAAQVVRLEKSLAESRELVAFKERVADEIDKDKETLFKRLEAERELVQEERIRANNLARRLAEAEASIRNLETRNSRLVESANLTEQTVAASLGESRQSIASRDRLLAAATTRVRAAAEILSQKRVAEAADDIVTTKGAILADAIRNALAALSE